MTDEEKAREWVCTNSGYSTKEFHGKKAYEAEKYCGEAEDIYDEFYGKSKEEEYYKDMEEQEERLRQEQIQNYDFERGDVKY